MSSTHNTGPVAVPLTAVELATMLQMREAGHAWDAIGRRLRTSRTRLCNEALRLGMDISARRGVVEVPLEGRRGAEALPAGHPISWDAIHQPYITSEDPG